MMQATNVKQVTKPVLASKVINQTLIQQSEKLDNEDKKVVELTKSQSFNRFLEANSDCV